MALFRTETTGPASTRGSGDHRISPSKSASLGRPSRPRTAPPNRVSSKSSRSESAHPISDTGGLVIKKDTLDGGRKSLQQPSAASGLSRGHFCKRNMFKLPFSGGRAKSPTKRVASRPPSASTASSSVAPSPAPLQNNEGCKQGLTPQQPQQQPPKRQRPSE